MLRHRKKYQRIALMSFCALTSVLAWSSSATNCGGIDLQAHRGSYKYPENTTEAVIQAYRDGYDTAEIDIQVLKDGKWVLHHDFVTGRVIRIGNSSLWKLPSTEITAYAWTHGSVMDRNNKTTELRPSILDETLNEATAYFNKGKKINIEIKGHYRCNVIETVFNSLRNADPKSYLFSSVDLEALECIRRINSNVYLALVVAPEPDTSILELRRTIGENNYAKLYGRVLKEDPMTLYDKIGNRNLMTKTGLDNLSKAGINGIHIDAKMLMESLDLIGWAKARNLKIYTYGAGPDSQHIATVNSVYKITSQRPDGMIVDGDSRRICESMRKAGLVK